MVIWKWLLEVRRPRKYIASKQYERSMGASRVKIYDTNMRSDLLQNAWRLLYALDQWLPARSSAMMAEAGESAVRSLTSQTAGQVYSEMFVKNDVVPSAEIIKALRTFSVDRIIVAGQPLIKKDLPYLTGAGATHMAALLSKRTPANISRNGLSVDYINEIGENGYFGKLRQRIYNLSLTEKQQHGAMLKQIQTVPTPQQQFAIFKQVSADESNMKLVAELFDICELLYAGALLMTRVIDGTDLFIVEKYKENYSTAATAEYEKVMAEHATLQNQLYRFFNIATQPLVGNDANMGTIGLALRVVVFTDPSGNPTQPESCAAFLLRACETLLSHCNKTYAFCAAAPGSQTELFTNRERGGIRLMLPETSYYSFRDSSRVALYKQNGVTIPNLTSVISGLLAPSAPGGAPEMEKDECKEVCITAVKNYTKLYDGAEADAMCAETCATDATRDPCLSERYRMARDDPSSVTLQKRAEKFASLVLNFGDDGIPSCRTDGERNKELCVQRVKAACMAKDCGINQSDIDINSFSSMTTGVCNPYEKDWADFYKSRKVTPTSIFAEEVRTKDAEYLKTVAAARATRAPCKDVLMGERCPATPLQCFVAALDQSKQLTEFPENEYGVIRSACAADVKAIRQADNKGFQKILNEAVDDPCSLIFNIRDKLPAGSPALSILEALNEKACTNSIESVGAINSFSIPMLADKVNTIWVAAQNHLLSNPGTKLPGNLKINETQYIAIKQQILTQSSLVHDETVNPVEVLFRAFELSFLDMYKFKNTPMELRRAHWMKRPITRFLQMLGNSQSTDLLGTAAALGYTEIATDFIMESLQYATYDNTIGDAVIEWVKTALDANSPVEAGSTRKAFLVGSDSTERRNPLVLDLVLKTIERRQKQDQYLKLTNEHKLLAFRKELGVLIHMLNTMFDMKPMREADEMILQLGENIVIPNNATDKIMSELKDRADALTAKIEVADGSLCATILEAVSDLLNHSKLASRFDAELEFWRALALGCFCSTDFLSNAMDLARKTILKTSGNTTAELANNIARCYMAVILLQTAPNTRKQQYLFIEKIHTDSLPNFDKWRKVLETILTENAVIRAGATQDTSNKPKTMETLEDRRKNLIQAQKNRERDNATFTSMVQQMFVSANTEELITQHKLTSGQQSTADDFLLSVASSFLINSEDENFRIWSFPDFTPTAKPAGDELNFDTVIRAFMALSGHETPKLRDFLIKVIAARKTQTIASGIVSTWFKIPEMFRIGHFKRPLQSADMNPVIRDCGIRIIELEFLRRANKIKMQFDERFTDLDKHADVDGDSYILYDASNSTEQKRSEGVSVNNQGPGLDPDALLSYATQWAALRNTGSVSYSVTDFEEGCARSVFETINSIDGNFNPIPRSKEMKDTTNYENSTSRMLYVPDNWMERQVKKFEPSLTLQPVGCLTPPESADSSCTTGDRVLQSEAANMINPLKFRDNLLVVSSRAVNVSDDVLSGLMLRKNPDDKVTDAVLARFLSSGTPPVAFKQLCNVQTQADMNLNQEKSVEAKTEVCAKVAANIVLSVACCHVEKFYALQLASVGAYAGGNLVQGIATMMARLFASTTVITKSKVKATLQDIRPTFDILNDYLHIVSNTGMPYVHLAMLPQDEVAMLSIDQRTPLDADEKAKLEECVRPFEPYTL